MGGGARAGLHLASRPFSAAWLQRSGSARLSIVLGGICRVALQHGGAVESTLWLRTADGPQVAADRLLGRIEWPPRREVHRPAPDARDEVRHEWPVRFALHDYALEVLVAARARFQLNAIHPLTVQIYSIS